MNLQLQKKVLQLSHFVCSLHKIKISFLLLYLSARQLPVFLFSFNQRRKEGRFELACKSKMAKSNYGANPAHSNGKRKPEFGELVDTFVNITAFRDCIFIHQFREMTSANLLALLLHVSQRLLPFRKSFVSVIVTDWQ